MRFPTRQKYFRNLMWASFAIAVSGCVSTEMSDLEIYRDDILATPGGRIEPLPPIKPYQRYLYKSGELGLRDPFKSFFKEEREKQEIRPADDPTQKLFATEILTHNREELEQAELDSLRMVGILENNDELWGIIRDVSGTVHRVQVGNYMGSNFGKILNIQEDRIDLREIVKDSLGRWEERQATLALSEE